MNSTPVYVRYTMETDTRKPILNKAGRVVDYTDWEESRTERGSAFLAVRPNEDVIVSLAKRGVTFASSDTMRRRVFIQSAERL